MNEIPLKEHGPLQYPLCPRFECESADGGRRQVGTHKLRAKSILMSLFKRTAELSDWNKPNVAKKKGDQ